MVGYYGAPLVLTTDDVLMSLGTSGEVVAWLQTQVDGMLAASYDHTEILASDVTVLNRNTAALRAELSRRRMDSDEINQMTVTYLITRTSAGFRSPRWQCTLPDRAESERQVPPLFIAGLDLAPAHP